MIPASFVVVVGSHPSGIKRTIFILFLEIPHLIMRMAPSGDGNAKAPANGAASRQAQQQSAAAAAETTDDEGLLMNKSVLEASKPRKTSSVEDRDEDYEDEDEDEQQRRPGDEDTTEEDDEKGGAAHAKGRKPGAAPAAAHHHHHGHAHGHHHGVHAVHAKRRVGAAPTGSKKSSVAPSPSASPRAPTPLENGTIGSHIMSPSASPLRSQMKLDLQKEQQQQEERHGLDSHLREQAYRVQHEYDSLRRFMSPLEESRKRLETMAQKNLIKGDEKGKGREK